MVAPATFLEQHQPSRTVGSQLIHTAYVRCFPLRLRLSDKRRWTQLPSVAAYARPNLRKAVSSSGAACLWKAIIWMLVCRRGRRECFAGFASSETQDGMEASVIQLAFLDRGCLRFPGPARHLLWARSYQDLLSATIDLTIEVHMQCFGTRCRKD
ncbi:hypothetical protein BKA93DRAFT_246625 [Sparassis latifolia]